MMDSNRSQQESSGQRGMSGNCRKPLGSQPKCCVCLKAFLLNNIALRDHFQSFPRYGSQKDRNSIPRILTCCHNACDSCIRTSLTSNNRVVCHSCNEESVFPKSSNYDAAFPVNTCLLGALSRGHSNSHNIDDQVVFDKNPLLCVSPGNVAKAPVQVCIECQGIGYSYCNSCRAVFCSPCFAKVHSGAKFLRDHKCSPLVADLPDKLIGSSCSYHRECKLEFFCRPCNISICTQCLISEHNGHKFLKISEKNMEYLDEVVEAYTSASNIHKIVKLSLKKANQAIMGAKETVGADRVEYTGRIKEHFIRLHSELIRMEVDLLSQVNSSSIYSSLKAATDSLIAVSERMTESLLKAKAQIQNPESSDFLGLMKELQELKSIPCVLVSEKNDPQSNNLYIDDDIVRVLNSHVTLRLSDPYTYAVKSVEEAPELAAEVAEQSCDETKAELELNAANNRTSNASSSNLSNDISISLERIHLSESCSISTHSSSLSLHSDSSSSIASLSAPDMLTPGVSYSVEVTHFTNPSDFYVQRIGTKNKLNKMSYELFRHVRQFAVGAARKKKTVRQLKQGNRCLAKYEGDDKWCRCEILSIEDGAIRVRYFDYGTVQTIPDNAVYPLPKSYMSLPPMAQRCGLVGVKPASGDQWDWQVTQHIAQMLKAGRAPLSVVVLHKDLRGIAQVRLVQEHPVCPQEIRLSLVYLGYAVNDGAVYPILHKPPLKLSFKPFAEQPPLNADELEDCTVRLVLIKNPDEFYVTISSEGFLRVDRELQREYQRPGKISVFYPDVGMSIAVFTENKRWERATILKPLPERKLEVFFVDNGRTETISWGSAKVLEPNFLQPHPQAYKCSLIHVKPVDGKWSDSTTELLQTYIGKPLMIMHAVRDSTTKSTQIQLVKCGEATNTCLNALIVQKGYATGTGSCADTVEVPHIPKLPNIKECQPTKNSKSFKKKGRKDPLAADCSIVPMPSDKLPSSDNSVMKVEGKIRLRVNVVKIVNPGEFYVTFDCHDGLYEKLNKKLEEFSVKEAPSSPQPDVLWKPNDRCLVKGKTGWKRGIVWEEPVIDDHQSMAVKVRLVDEFDSVVVPADAVVPLPNSFHEPGDRVVSCRLGGILPAPESTWSQSSIQEFNDFVNAFNVKLYVLKMKKLPDNNKFAPVELFSQVVANQVLLGDPGTNHTKNPSGSWKSFNHFLRMRGMAKSDQYTVWNSQGGRYHVSDANVTDSDKADCIRNVMDDDQERLRFLLKERFRETSDGKVDISSPREEFFNKVRWFPAEPLSSLDLAGRITFIGASCEVYVQDYLNTPLLSQINEEVAKLCSGTEPEEVDWEVGDICLAKFTDEQWYRGVINELNVRGAHMVKFVDYGNIEYVLPENLRVARGLPMRPIQVTVCHFDNLAPVTEKWEHSHLQGIHSFLVDQVCRITLRRLSSGHHGIVKLYLPDNTDALKEIVSRGFGRYLNVQPSDSLHSPLLKSDSTVSSTKCNDNTAESNTECDSETDASWVTYSADSDVVVADAMSISHPPAFWWYFWYKQKRREGGRVLELLKFPDTLNYFQADIVTVLYPDFFIAQLVEVPHEGMKKQVERFVELQEKIQSEAEEQPRLSSPDALKECCSQYEDGVWYRAVILREGSIEGRKTVILQYVDYGNLEEKSIEDLREMKDEWFDVPVVGIPLRPFGFKFSPKSELSELESKEIVSELVCNELSLFAFLKKRDADVHVADLTLGNGELVYQHLIDSGFYQPREE